MTEEIIIDGVNIAECEYYTTMEDCDGTHDLCEQLDDYCSIKKNCYYKQLQRLKQENEKLLEARNHFMAVNLKYFTALEKIRKLATINVSFENFVEIQKVILEAEK